MAYPDDFTYAIDGTTEIIAAHINNLEIKVGITGDTNPTSLDYRVAQLETAPPADVALLPGRAGGQYLRGGIASGEDLTLGSTAHATKGKLLFGNSGDSYFEETLQNLKIAGHIAFGNTSSLSAATVLFIDETTSQQYPVGIFNYLHPEYSGTPSSAIGFGNIVNREAPGDFGTIWSGYFTAWAGNQDSPQKTINDVRAMFLSAGCVGDYNTVNYLSGLTAQATIAWNMVSCNVGEMYGADIGIFIGSGDIDLPLAKSLNIYATQGGVVTGTLGTLYGIYINDHSLLGFSTHYNLYSVGVTSKNKFEGIVEIGNNIVINNADEIFMYKVTGVNYERFYSRWESDVFKIGTEASGTGVARNIAMYSGEAIYLFSPNDAGSHMGVDPRGVQLHGIGVVHAVSRHKVVVDAPSLNMNTENTHLDFWNNNDYEDVTYGGQVNSYSDYSGTVPGAVLVSVPLVTQSPGSSIYVSIENSEYYEGEYVGVVVNGTSFYIIVEWQDDEFPTSYTILNNYERLRMGFESNIFKIKTEKGGGGTVRNILISSPLVSLDGTLELGNTATAIASLANTVRLYGKDIDFLPFITDHASLYVQPEVGRPIVFDNNCMTMFENWTNPTNYTRIDIGYNNFDAFWGIKTTAKGTGPTVFGAQNGMILPYVGIWSYNTPYAYIGWATPSGSGVVFSNEVTFDWSNKLVQFSNLFSGSGLKLLLNSELEVATGDEIAFSLNYEVNKATSGDAYGLKITPTLTTVPGNVYNIYSVGSTALNLFEGKVIAGPIGGPPIPLPVTFLAACLPAYANNAAALGGGLSPGDFYMQYLGPGPAPDPVPVCIVMVP
jgi:hypothetical protein